MGHYTTFLGQAALVYRQTAAEILAKGLSVAQSVGLDTSSWHDGDPTKTLFAYLAEILENLEETAAGYIEAGWLDFATGTWLTLLADQVYGVTRTAGTYASTSVTLTNSGGGEFTIAAGNVTLQNSATGATYRNTDGGTLGAGGTLSLSFTADEIGTDGNAAATEIDTIVSPTMTGVTVSNPAAATGTDAETDADLRTRCKAKLGSLSPNGPRDAYVYVATTPALSLTSNVTRARATGSGTTGDVNVYLAGDSGAVAGADVTLVTTAIANYAAPLTATPIVASASNKVITVTYELWIYNSVGKTETEIKADIQTALQDLIKARPIAGDVIPPATTGSLYHEHVEATIQRTFNDHIFKIDLSAPAGDTALLASEVATLGTVTGTINLVQDP